MGGSEGLSGYEQEELEDFKADLSRFGESFRAHTAENMVDC